MPNLKELLPKIKELNDIKDFNVVQKSALKEEYLDKNLIVASPTSSGKTLIAEVFSLYTVLNKRKRVIFISPLKALTYEHSHGFKKKYEKEFDLKVGISTGDLDSSSKYLENYQIIFLTFEKLDSLIRHKASWLHTVGLLIVDEIHNLDSNRGAVLETTIIELNQIIPTIKIIGLSATISNAKELASWIKGELIYSEYRPVKLNKGVFFENKIKFDDNSEKRIIERFGAIDDLVIDTLEKNKQALIFTNTRRNSEIIAKKMQKYTKKYLTNKDKKTIGKAIEEIDYSLNTEYDKDIANNLLSGASFHHAGLRNTLRTKTEELFKKGALKIIVSTPTLAAGINMPAYRVIIHTVYRHSQNGMQTISVKEYVQMSGRAGRLGLDEKGESILIARNEFDVDNLFDRFVLAVPEDIESQLGFVPILRTQLLAIIANEVVFDDSSLNNFFENTFYAIRFGDLNSLMHKIEIILRELVNFGFVKIDKGVIKATDIGKRISELYIDPLSAYNIINKINKFEDLTDKEFLMLITNTIEMRPYFSPNKNKYNLLKEQLQEEYKELGLEISELLEDYEIIEKYYTMQILYGWVSEISEQDLFNNYNILPGALHNKLYSASWICYALGEIAKILNKNIIHKRAVVFEKRIKQGVKEELLLLTELPNIGRARARKLFFNNIKSISDLKNCDPHRLINILGLKIADKLMKHLKMDFDINSIFVPKNDDKKRETKNENEDKNKSKRRNITKKRIKEEAKLQKNLFDF